MTKRQNGLKPTQKESASQRRKKLIAVPEIISISALFLAASLLVSSYFGKNIISLFIFSPNDGWCLNNQTGIGVHCFGDFGAPLTFSGHGLNGFYSSTVVSQYPPLNYYLFAIFRFIATHFTYRSSLALFLLIMLGGFLASFFNAMSRPHITKIEKFSYSVGLLSLLPIIMTLDRGNIIGYTLPLLFLYSSQNSHISKTRRILSVCLLVNLKPQFILLLIWKFRGNKWKEAVEEFVAIVLSYLFFFFVGAPKYFLQNIKIFVHSLLNYGNIDFNRQYPYNYSFAQGIHNFQSAFFGREIFPGLTSYEAILFSIVVLLCIIWNRKYLSSSLTIFLVIPLIFLIPTLSFAYYSLVLVPLVVSENNIFSLDFPKAVGGKMAKYTFIFCVLITILPIYLGNDMLGVARNPYNVIQILLPSLWAVTYAIFILSTVWRKINPKNQIATKLK